MAHPQLDNLVRIGRLKNEPAADAEIEGMFISGGCFDSNKVDCRY